MSLKNNNQEEVQTREQIKKAKKEEQGQNREKRKRVRIRLIPIWLRVIIVLLLLAGSVIAGAMVGYGILGGGNATEIFEKSTWTHIIDLIEGE